MIKRNVPVVAVSLLAGVPRPAGFAWNTSLSRTDSSDGACEVMWIEGVRVN